MGRLSGSMVYRIAEQVVEAVRHLHEIHICHRDPMLESYLCKCDTDVGVLLKLGCVRSHSRCPTQLLRAAHSATRVPPPSFCPKEVYGSSFAVHGRSRPCQS